MKRILIFLFFISAVGVFKAQSVTTQSLKGSGWIITSIDNIETGKSQVIDASVKFTLKFDGDTTYSGLGCNTYKGNYKSDGLKTLTMKKAESQGNSNCLGLGPLELKIWMLYQKATRYRMTGDALFIFTSDDHRLVFKKF